MSDHDWQLSSSTVEFRQAERDAANGRDIRDARRRACDHEWRYDEHESAGPWTGYIERCEKCGALQQVPQ